MSSIAGVSGDQTEFLPRQWKSDSGFLFVKCFCSVKKCVTKYSSVTSSNRGVISAHEETNRLNDDRFTKEENLEFYCLYIR